MTAAEYDELKRFLALFYEWFMANTTHRSQSHPVTVLEKLEKNSRPQAKRGLQLAINDCIEYSSEWSPETCALADKRLLLNGAPTLSEVRTKYSVKYLRVLKRGSIKSLNEYYLVKGIVDGGVIELCTTEGQKLAAMMTDYENIISPPSDN